MLLFLWPNTGHLAKRRQITLFHLNLKYKIVFENPVAASDIISAFIDNNNKFDIHLWLSLDTNVFINITEHNADKIIRYLFERYPY